MSGAEFPQSPKVNCSCESFHEPRWTKARKQLPLIYMEAFLSILKPKHIISLRIF